MQRAARANQSFEQAPTMLWKLGIEKCLLVNKHYKMMMMMYDKGSRGNGRRHIDQSRLSFDKVIMMMTMMMMMIIIK